MGTKPYLKDGGTKFLEYRQVYYKVCLLGFVSLGMMG